MDVSNRGRWRDSTIAGLLVELRPHQWYKQLILFIPLVYSGQADRPDAWFLIGVGAVVFTAVAGCVYIVNDVFDVEEDRRHPEKKHRPIARGQVPVRTAAVVALTGFLLAGAVALWLGPLFLLVVAAYVLQNFAYSAVAKHVFLVDIFIVGSGFVLRALAGVVLIDAPMSPWLLLAVFLAAFLLASAKRHAEHALEDRTETRESLEGFTAEFSVFLLFLAAATLVVVYSLYTFFARQTEMMVTIPFAYYSVLRFTHLAMVEPSETISDLLFRRDMVANFALWGIATLIILYFFPLP